MADFIVSPYALSFNSIKQSLQQYISNKANATWKDFYIAGAGETIIELDAAIAAFYAFHFIIGRREAYLLTAQNYNSVVGGAQTLGYSASRGNNIHIYIDIVPNSTQTLSKWTLVGSYAEYDIVLWEQAVLNVGEQTTLHCVIGNSMAQQITISSNELQQFTFTAANTTDDCRLILNNIELPVATRIQEAIYDNWITITNTFGAIDAFYWQQGDYKYVANDSLYFHYIEKNNLKFGAINPSNINLDIAPEAIDVRLCLDAQDPEDKEHIRAAAPLSHETNSVVRGRKDYAKYLLILNRNIIDVNDYDISPGLIALTYLKSRTGGEITSLLTPEEKEQFMDSIRGMCPDGVADAYIVDPVRVIRHLDVELWPIQGQNISIDVDKEIDTILDQYRNKLHPSLDLEQIEHEIEQIAGVKIARVNIGIKEYQTNTRYKLYDVVTVPNILYGNELQTWTMYCAAIQTRSGETEPDWGSAGNPGDTLFDNNIVWQNSNKYANTSAGGWDSNGDYNLYDDINVGYSIEPECSGETEPVWGETILNDGNVSYNLIETFTPKLKDWVSEKLYDIGDTVLHAVGDHQVIYQVSQVKRISGKQKPDFGSVQKLNEEISDNALTWTFVYDSWKPLCPYTEGDIIAKESGGRVYIYQAQDTNVSGKSDTIFDGTANVKDEESTQGTLINWTLIDTIESIKEWAASTELEAGTLIKEQYEYHYTDNTEGEAQSKQTNLYRFFEVTFTDTFRSGEEAPKWSKDENVTVENNVEDNTLVWSIREYTVTGAEQEKVLCDGKKWTASTKYVVGDTLIVTDSTRTYLYRVYYTNPITTYVENKIYSVVDYSGQTGETEPEWGDSNVIDNDILWTKTENESSIQWEANKVYRFGTIISTSAGYYTFSSIIGLSGQTAPNWAGMTNNQVKDGVITWVRIQTSTTLPLAWNEYLELDFNVRIVS